MPLSGHRHVEGPVEAEPHRAPGHRGADRRDGGEAVRLHLLAAETAAHPQALDGHLVRRTAEDVGDDVLGLGRVLGARVDEDLPRLVDQGDGAVRLEVEVLLPFIVVSPEDVCRPGHRRCGVAAGHHRAGALEALGGDGLPRRSSVPGASRSRPRRPPRRSRAASSESPVPAHRVAAEHDLGGEERLVVLDAGVVDARDVRPVSTLTTPGTASAGSVRRPVTLAWACGEPTGRAWSSPVNRPARSSVYSAAPVTWRSADSWTTDSPTTGLAGRWARAVIVRLLSSRGVFGIQLAQRRAEHGPAVRLARPVVPERGALAGEDLGDPVDLCLGPGRTGERGLGGQGPQGWRRPRRGRSGPR